MRDVIAIAVLVAAAYVTGRLAERRHYRSILEREASLRDLPAIAARRAPESSPAAETFLVTGSVVVSVDYFKRLVSGLQMLVGGRLNLYEPLLDRARREAVLRMKAEARRRGANAVYNVKLETSSISKGRREAVGSVEVLAYGTAVVPRAG